MRTTATNSNALRRLSAALLVTIVFLAGFTAGIAFDQPVSSDPAIDRPADIETAHAFYRALDAVLAGGDPGALSAMLAGYFLDHETGTGETRSAEAFLTRLQTLARSAPGYRLEIDSVEQLGSNLIVAVRQMRTAPIRIAGLTVEAHADAGSYDVLRIERGKVAGLWTSRLDWLDVTTFDEEETSLHTSGKVGNTPVLKQIVVPGGAQLSWTSGAEALLFVEAGSVRMTSTVSDEDADTVALDSGMAMRIPAAAHHRLRSDGGEDATVLLYSAPANPPASYNAPPGISLNTGPPAMDVIDGQDVGVTQTVLWQGNLAEVGWDRVHSGGRLVLPVGGAVELVPESRTLVLVSIDGGSLEISARGGTASKLGEDAARDEADGVVLAGVDRGAFVDANGDISLRNTGGEPVAILLITIDSTPMGAASASI